MPAVEYRVLPGARLSTPTEGGGISPGDSDAARRLNLVRLSTPQVARYQRRPVPSGVEGRAKNGIAGGLGQSRLGCREGRAVCRERRLIHRPPRSCPEARAPEQR